MAAKIIYIALQMYPVRPMRISPPRSSLNGKINKNPLYLFIFRRKPPPYLHFEIRAKLYGSATKFELSNYDSVQYTS